MATLTEVSFYARRGIKWGAIGLVIIMLIPPTLTLIRRVYLAINPPPPPAPTVRYGKLPMLVFPSTTNNFSKLNYRLETIEGGLPKLTNVSKIYFVSINKSRILELERIKAKAAVLGFSQAPEKADEQTYKFVHAALPSQLTVNIIYNSYIYGYDWRSDADILGGRDVPNNGQALVEAKNFWQNLGLLAGDLADGKAKFTYLALNGGELVPTTALSEANFVRVDLQRSDKDGLPVVTPTNLPVYVIFSGAPDRSKRVIEARYAYSKILDDNFSTYPLKSVDQAWNELQAGGGYVANPSASSGQVAIRKAFLAYYESDTPQEFFQPVFVFEGDGGFVAYVPAVSAEYSQ